MVFATDASAGGTGSGTACIIAIIITGAIMLWVRNRKH